MTKENLLLIGMPATGKSTLGLMLAEKLNKSFVDTDTVIEQISGMACHKLIDLYGIETFSKYEDQALRSQQEKQLVISTGGSAVYCYDAMMELKENAIVVHLSASFETLESRISNFSTRAIVMFDGMNFKDLYHERMPLYREIADIELVTDQADDTPDESLEKVLLALKEFQSYE